MHPRLGALASIVSALFIAFAMSVVSYRLFTQNNDFPLSYHPDEGSKVDQVASSRQFRNMNHPLLLLETANLLADYWQTPRENDREMAIVGRSASALIASAGVFCFAMTGFVCYRFVGLLVVGTAAMLCPSLLVFAHYMKEDAALAGGIGVAMLGTALTLAARRTGTQVLASIVLGVGVAAAASGKYVGAAALLPAILALCIARIPRWWALPLRFLVFVPVAIAAFVAINARGFEDPWTLSLSPRTQYAFEEELEHGISEHAGIRLATPGLYCLRIAAENWQTHLLVFAGVGLGVGLWSLSRKWSAMTRWGWVATSFLATFVIVLSFNAIPFARYALPITVLGYVLAACAVSAAIVRLAGRWHSASLFTALALMPILFLQGRQCLQYDHQFADDSRERLSQWIAKNVPPGTRIVADSFAALDRVGDVWRFPDRPRGRAIIISRFHASHSGPLATLARSGVKYVVTAEPNYQRFFAPGVVAVEGGEDALEYHRDFYRTLFERGTLVWSSKPTPPSGAYVDPELRVYDITPFRNDPVPRQPARRWYERFWG